MSARGRRITLLGGLVLVAIGTTVWWAVVRFHSIPADWRLNDALIARLQGVGIGVVRIPLADVFPDRWDRVCFFGPYQGQEAIMRRSRIDITGTRAMVWAGRETAMTVMFFSESIVIAQRLDASRTFDLENDASDQQCGGRDSFIQARGISVKPYLDYSYRIKFVGR